MSAYLEKWRAAADDLLSVVLVKSNAWQKAIEAGVQLSDMPPGNWQQLYKAAIDIRGAQLKQKNAPVVLSDVELAAKCDGAVTVEWVATRIALWDEYRESYFDTTCALLQQYGTGHRQLEAIRRGTVRLQSALENGGSVDEAVGSVVDELRSETAEHVTEPVDIADLNEIARAQKEAPPQPGLKTGIWLVDSWLRGIMPGEFIAWVAPYKSRKTSVMADVLLNMARDDKSVTVFSYDESRLRFYYRLVAILMAEYAYKNGLEHVRSPEGALLNVFDAKMIRNAGNQWRKWPKQFQTAREYAEDELAALRGKIRIYDPKTGANTIRSIKAITQHDAMKYGDLDVVMLDHIQRIGGFKDTYERVEFGSGALHDLAGEMGCVMWVLSQQNEEAIKGADEGSYTPNAKGGGGIASNADTVLVSKYKKGTVTDPNFLRLELRLAREAEAPVYGYVEMHPQSGWITPRYVDTNTVTTASIDDGPGYANVRTTANGNE